MKGALFDYRNSSMIIPIYQIGPITDAGADSVQLSIEQISLQG
jgi:hypothetical protein